MSDEYVAESIAELGLALERPAWWHTRIDDHPSGKTFTCWDEYTGTLRISPVHVSSTFVADEFLDRELARPGREARTLGERRFVCYQDDSQEDDGPTRMHYFIAGSGEHMLICSFAYAVELLDDEIGAGEVEGALEEAERVLASMRFNGR